MIEWSKYKTNLKKVDFNNLTYFFKGNTASIHFIGFKGPLHIFISIYSGSIPLEDAEKNSENSKTSEYHVLVLKLTDKLDLRRGQKSVALSNLSICDTWKNVKGSYNNNKFKISTPTWSEEFKLPDGSYSISDIQDYFEYI